MLIGTLYIVGTPIGNLGDITIRALKTLKEVDFIAAEDTRVTIKLLNHFEIKKPIISYFEHNKKEKGTLICNKIKNGESCALVSDAGMPAISDPGEDLVKQCHLYNIDVKVVPGPCALISAVCLSGMPSGRFTFEGFLSTNKKNRCEHLNSLKSETRTMIFYEAPHKLLNTLKGLHDTLGNRDIAIIKELTKIHEEIKFMKLDDSINFYKDNKIKGEFVLIIPGIDKDENKIEYTLEQAVEMAKKFILNGDNKTNASKKVAKVTNIRKSDIYKNIISN